MPRRPSAARTAVALVVGLLAALLGGLVAATPVAAARTVDVVLTAAEPGAVSIAPGDSVRFISGEQGSAPPHRVTSTERDGSTPWTYESRLLAPGEFTEPVVLDQPGSYLYVDRRGLITASETVGRVVVSAPAVGAERPAVEALHGPLPGASTSRGFGLPATLAVLAVVGVASLLVRVLLAEPSAQRRRPLAPVAVTVG